MNHGENCECALCSDCYGAAGQKMPDTVDKKWLDDEEAKRYWEMAVEQALFGDESNHPRSFLAMDILHAAALIESLREENKRLKGFAGEIRRMATQFCAVDDTRLEGALKRHGLFETDND